MRKLLRGRHINSYTQAPTSNTFLFVAINGAGLGHLTRCLAIARRIESDEPNAEIVFYTTSLATVLVNRFGYKCFHIPPFAQVKSAEMDTARWNRIFANHLKDVVENYRPRCLIFDGTYVYSGLQQVIRDFPHLPCIWVKRAGRSQKKSDEIASQTKFFTTVIVPGDVGEPAPTELNSEDTRYIAPVLLLRREELLSRTDARQHLGFDDKATVVYVQLGAGNINELSKLEHDVLEVLEEFQTVSVLLATSPISIRPSPRGSEVGSISSYPNAMYFNGFDFAITAAGYNSVNEVVAYDLPSILTPNLETQSDDQLARANSAKASGRHFIWDGVDQGQLRQAVVKLTSNRRNSPSTDIPKGAEEAASLIVAVSTKVA